MKTPRVKVVDQTRRRQLTPGRSRNSILLIAWKHVHVFVWTPRFGGDSIGITIRHRTGPDWLHYRLVLMQRNPPNVRSRPRARYGTQLRARRTLTILELSQWRTKGTYERTGLKRYIRVKLGPGGREVALPQRHPSPPSTAPTRQSHPPA